ncbi:DUF6011 domain-containing protein [Streptomyces sp. NPDC087440]|uniref:DUF6011 domain-containing protein n=1 Tax=Streptomyces sp. NPDC087440 TaxID=3365790 RepID=UPI00382D70CD
MNRRRPDQPTLIDDPQTGARHRYCRRCGAELKSPESRMNGYGPDCDPHRRPPAADTHQVDQDTLPGI